MFFVWPSDSPFNGMIVIVSQSSFRLWSKKPMALQSITSISCIDLTNTILSSDDIETDLEPTVQEIPQEIKELIWQDYEALLTKLLELGIEDTEEAEELLTRIQTRQEQDLYYTKYVDAGGIAIIGAKTLTDEVMIEAQDIALAMTAKRPELRVQLSPETGFYFILTDIEYTRGNVKTLPEWNVWELILSRGPLVYINIGMCLGIDGRYICTSNAAKNVKIQSRPHDKTCSSYWCNTNLYLKDWSTFVHEMAHAIDHAARQIDPNFNSELQNAYQNAKQKELWDNGKVLSGGYAMTNIREYWAVASEYWFFIQRATRYTTHHFPEGVEVPEQRREDLKLRDPLIYALLEKWYPAVEPFGATPP